MFFSKQFRGNPESAATLADTDARAGFEALSTNQRETKDEASDTAATSLSARTLRIATYNIHKGVSGFAWRNRIHDLRRGLHRLNADLVFLQEVQGKNDRHAERFANWPEAAQHDFLADAGWAEAVYGRNAIHNKGRYASDHGNALLSRFPMLSHENIDVSDHRFESRGLLHCEIEWNGQRLHGICAHLGLFEDSRNRQADALIARIRDHVPDDAPLIIAGDFNDWRGLLCSKLIGQLGVQEVFDLVQQATVPVLKANRFKWPDALRLASSAPATGKTIVPRTVARPARTFPSLFPLLRLDRVYVRGFSVSHARVMHGIAWRRLSDHAPIVADLVLNEVVPTTTPTSNETR